MNHRTLTVVLAACLGLAACGGGGAQRGADVPVDGAAVADPGLAVDSDTPDVASQDAVAADAVAADAVAADMHTPDTLPTDASATDASATDAPPADANATDPGATDVAGDTVGPLPDDFFLLPEGFFGVAGVLSVRTATGVVHPEGRSVDLVTGTGPDSSAVVASALTDARGVFVIGFPQGFVPSPDTALRLVASHPDGSLSASYTGPIVHVDAASDVAMALEPTLPALAFRQKALLADFVRAIGAATATAPSAADLGPFRGGLVALFGPGQRSPGVARVRAYFDSVEDLKADIALFCATTTFSKASVAAFLARFETYVPGFLAADDFLDQAPTPTASLLALQKADFEMDLVLFLMMIADIADDHLAEGFGSDQAVHAARAYCGYLGRAVPALVTWAPELAFETTIAAAEAIEIPEDVPIDPEDLAETGDLPSPAAKIEFVFVDPMAQEPAHLAGLVGEYCAWERAKSWQCEVDRFRGLSFSCPPGDPNCCDDCDCYTSDNGCSFLTGCYSCMPPAAGTYACHSQNEVERGMQFAVPLSNAFVGLLIEVGDRARLFDDTTKQWFTVDLYYDDVRIATTGSPYNMGPTYVGPPIDDEDMFATITDFVFLTFLNGLSKIHTPEVLQKVRLIVGTPSEADEGEHHSYFFESRGDAFNGALLVWRLSIADGRVALNGLKDTTSSGCPQLAAPADAVSQDHYLKGAFPVDLDALADAGNPGIVNAHEVRAVLTLTDGTTLEAKLPIPAPAPDVACPACETTGSDPAAHPGQDGECRSVLGEDYALQGTAQMKRIRNRLTGDLIGLAGGELVTGLAESALSKLEHLDFVAGLESMSLKVESMFDSPVLDGWVDHAVNRVGTFLQGSAAAGAWDSAKKFLSGMLGDVVKTVAGGLPPNANLPMDAPGWIATAEEYDAWKQVVDFCEQVLCPWANGNLRILRQSMKTYGDAADWSMDVVDRLTDWTTMSADTGEYAHFLRGTSKVTGATGLTVGRLSAVSLIAKSIGVTSKVAAGVYAVLVVGRRIELGESVIATQGAFRTQTSPCGDPEYAIY